MPRRSAAPTTPTAASVSPAATAVIDPDRIQHLDPNDLIVDLDNNVRVRAVLDEQFLASVRENGVQEPIAAVLTDDGAVRVERGHRRTLAARETGRETIPVRVIGRDSVEVAQAVDRLVRQVEENEQRAGLTEADHVKVATQLTALDLTAEQVARRTRRTPAQVEAALTVAGSSTAQAVVARYELDVTQAAVIAEFEDDPNVVETLVTAARNGQFAHAVQRARQDRIEAAARELVAAPLRAAGVTVLKEWGGTWRALEDLVDAASREDLDVQTHATCPGHSAMIEEEWREDEDGEEDATGGAGDEPRGPVLVAVYGCSDPREHGHMFRWQRFAPAADETDAPTPEQAEALKEASRAQRRDVIMSNKAWRAATVVRRRWLRQVASRKASPRGTAAFLAVAQAHDAATLAEVKGNHLAASLFGLQAPHWGTSAEVASTIEAAAPTRVQLLHLVLTLAAYEAMTSERDWRNPSPRTGRYLTFVEKCGYRLSPVEERALGRRGDLSDTTAEPDDQLDT